MRKAGCSNLSRADFIIAGETLQNFDLFWALIPIEQWGFFSVPHLLWHGASVYNGHLWGPVTLTCCLLPSFEKWSFTNCFNAMAVAQWLERSPRKQEVECSNPSRDRPKSLKQAVTVPLPNARHEVWVSRVLGDDRYKRMPRVTVGVARERTLTAQWV